jgi:hypothetical protein
MKFSQTVEKSIKGGEITTFFIDGIKVAETKKKGDWFCTVKNGTRSNIRDKFKLSFTTTWNRAGLEQVLGRVPEIGSSSRMAPIFNEDYPDHMWGYAGSKLSMKQVKNCIAAYKQVEKETL